MDFFNIGPGELLFILVFALIIFGPGKLPEVARGLGKAISDFRRASQGLTDGLTRELSTSPAGRAEQSEPSPVQTASSDETPAATSAPATAPTPGVAQPTVPLQTASAGASVSAQAQPTGSPQDAAASQPKTENTEAAVETQSATA